MRPLVLALSLALLPASAAGQVACPTGLVSPDSIHCCWPGQGWSAETRSCAGEPECPGGIQARDGTCVSAAAPAPAAPPASVAPPDAIPVPTAAPAASVVVSFRAADSGDRFTVTTEGTTCTTPCSISMRPGQRLVRIGGDASFIKSLRITKGPLEAVIDRRDGGMLTLGIASLSAGGLAFGVGLLVAYVSEIVVLADGSSGGRHLEDAKMVRNAGLVAAGVGATVAIVGGVVGLTNTGRNRVRLKTADGRRADAGPELLGLGAAPTEGGWMLGAAFSF